MDYFMSLRNALESMNADDRVKIGASDGGCYFYCGTAGDFLESAEEYTKQAKDGWAKLYKKTGEKFDNTVNQPPTLKEAHQHYLPQTIENVIENAQNQAADLDGKKAHPLHRFFKELADWVKSMEEWSAKRLDAYERMMAFVPFLDREVKEHFLCAPNVDEGKTYAIHVIGYEIGSFWYFGEAPSVPAFAPKFAYRVNTKVELEVAS